MVVEFQCLISFSLLAPERFPLMTFSSVSCDLGLPGISSLVLARGGAAVIKKPNNNVCLFRRD